jgi:hypothetical protein
MGREASPTIIIENKAVRNPRTTAIEYSGLWSLVDIW